MQIIIAVETKYLGCGKVQYLKLLLEFNSRRLVPVGHLSLPVRFLK